MANNEDDKMSEKLEKIKVQLDELSDDERMELFLNYCRSCGCDDPGCCCWNDD